MKSVFFSSALMFITLLCSESTSANIETLTITYGANYKPFSWEENAQPVGIQIDFVEELLSQRLGLKVKHETCPWRRCQFEVRHGTKDGFFTVPTPERAEYALKSDIPFYQTNFLMHVGKQNTRLHQLRKLQNLDQLRAIPDIRHVHMLGSGWHENALKNLPQVHEISDPTLIPVFLQSLRADVYIEQPEMLRFQARKVGVQDQIVTLEQPVIHSLGWHLFIARNSSHRQILPRLNGLLSELRATGELEEIKQRIFSKYGVL